MSQTYLVVTSLFARIVAVNGSPNVNLPLKATSVMVESNRSIVLLRVQRLRAGVACVKWSQWVSWTWVLGLAACRFASLIQISVLLLLSPFLHANEDLRKG